MKSKAIPTKYAGVNFRSRLEARWAAMFDELEWPWEYEPIDLAGYIPDFVLAFKRPMIVEVKPLLGSPLDWPQSNEGSKALRKAIDSGWEGEGLLVGASLFTSSSADGVVQSGDPTNLGVLFCSTKFIFPEMESKHAADIYAAPFGLHECCGGPVDCIGSYVCRRCGYYDGNNALMSTAWARERWGAAGNAVQWRSTEVRQHVTHQRPDQEWRTKGQIPDDKRNLEPDAVRDFFAAFDWGEDE